MIELLLVVGIASLLLAVGLICSFLPWHVVFLVGLWLVAGGLGMGVPAGLGYHVSLFRALKPGASLITLLLRPTRLHGQIDAADRRRILIWFAVGAAGFVIAIFGCGLVAIGALRSR